MRRRPDHLAIAFCCVAIAAALLFLPGRTGWGVAAGVAALIAVGGLFWMRSHEQRDTQGEIGKLLLFGLAAALPSLIISHAIDERQNAASAPFAHIRLSRSPQLYTQ